MFYDKFSDQLTDLATKIFNQKKYAGVNMYSVSEVETTITDYIKICRKIYKASGKTVFYTAVNPQEKLKALSDDFIKIIYMTKKKLLSQKELNQHLQAGKLDIQARDSIWITLSLIMQYGSSNVIFKKFWQPQKYFLIEETEEDQSEAEDSMAWMLIPAGLALLTMTG